MKTDFHPKFTAGSLAGALTVVIIAEAQRRGIVIDGTEGASITLILTCIASYVIPAIDYP